MEDQRKAILTDCLLAAVSVEALDSKFSLACLGSSFLLRGVRRGQFSFQSKRGEIMKADGLQTLAEELPWRNPLSACRSWLNECMAIKRWSRKP
jgi:hypothetical protein